MVFATDEQCAEMKRIRAISSYGFWVNVHMYAAIQNKRRLTKNELWSFASDLRKRTTKTNEEG